MGQIRERVEFTTVVIIFVDLAKRFKISASSSHKLRECYVEMVDLWNGIRCVLKVSFNYSNRIR